MGEAIAVDDSGSPPSVQIIFSAIDEEKEGDCALPPEEWEGLQDAAAGRPGEPPLPLHKPLKIYPTISDLRRLLHLRLHLPGPKNSPVYIQSLPEHCLGLKKIKSFLLNKVAFKEYTIYRACSLQKTPSGGPHPSKKKREKEKSEKEKRKENRERSKDKKRTKEWKGERNGEIRNQGMQQDRKRKKGS